jgi:hypothetical protein
VHLPNKVPYDDNHMFFTTAGTQEYPKFLLVRISLLAPLVLTIHPPAPSRD